MSCSIKDALRLSSDPMGPLCMYFQGSRGTEHLIAFWACPPLLFRVCVRLLWMLSHLMNARGDVKIPVR